MTLKTRHIVAGCLALVAATTTQAADPLAGKALSKQCSVCHGKLGIAKDPEVPNLAGQSAFYTEKSLKDYQTGKREDRRMTLMVQGLTEQQIKDIAAWYESIEVTVTPPEE